MDETQTWCGCYGRNCGKPNSLPADVTTYHQHAQVSSGLKVCNFLKAKTTSCLNLPLLLLRRDACIMGKGALHPADMKWHGRSPDLLHMHLCLQLSVPWNGKCLITSTLVPAAECLLKTSFYADSLQTFLFLFVTTLNFLWFSNHRVAVLEN